MVLKWRDLLNGGVLNFRDHCIGTVWKMKGSVFKELILAQVAEIGEGWQHWAKITSESGK